MTKLKIFSLRHPKNYLTGTIKQYTIKQSVEIMNDTIVALGISNIKSIKDYENEQY